MKYKIVSVIVLLLLLKDSLLFSKTANIGFFNALHLGWKGKNYYQSGILLTNFDLIGLVEIMSEDGISNLTETIKEITGKEWKYFISEYPVGSSSYKEYFGYIWNRDVVIMLTNYGYYIEKNPDDFEREPYGADFKIGNFDFTFVLCHNIFGKSKTRRLNEASKLGYVYDYFQLINSNEQDVIIAGDFNLQADDPAFVNLLKKDNFIYCLNPKIKTTIGTKGFANSYDNIFLSRKWTKEYANSSGIINSIEINKDYSFEMIRKVISDHVPIWIKVYTNLNDDD